MSMYDRLLAITAVIPPFVLLWYAEQFERRVREPTSGWRYRVMVSAGLASVPIAWTERGVDLLTRGLAEPTATLFNAFVIAATVEECGKAACLLLLTRGMLRPRTRYGAMLYSLHAAMGFALVENVLAMLKTSDVVAFSTRYFLRAYMTVPMHLVAGGALGYLWARRTFDRGPIGIAGGLCIAISIHGTFNTTLLAIEALPPDREALRIWCAVVAMAIPLLGAPLLYVLARRLREVDRRQDASDSVRGRRLNRVPAPEA